MSNLEIGKKKMSEYCFIDKACIVFIGVVLVVGVALRIDGLSVRGLEYDEIWTYLEYVRGFDPIAALADVSTPNNHSLHTLLCQAAVLAFGETSGILRLTALSCGVLSILLSAFLAWRLFESMSAALTACALTAFSAPLIHYSQTARGYSLQGLLILVAACALLIRQNNGGGRLLPGALFAVFGMFSVLALPTGAVFAAAVFAAWVVSEFDWRSPRDFIKPNIGLFAGFSVFCLFCAGWFTLHFNKFREGQSNGSAISGWNEFAVFSWDTLQSAGWIVPVLGLALLSDSRFRRFAVFMAVLTTLVLMSAIIVKAGPVRVYTPLLPLLAALAGGGVLALERRLGRLGVAVAAACVMAISTFGVRAAVNEWTPVDWRAVFPVLSETLQKSVFIAYPASESYPVRYNNHPQATSDNLERVACMGAFLAQVECRGNIGAMDMMTEWNSPVRVPDSLSPRELRIAGVSVQVYALRPICSGMPLNGKVVLCRLGPASAASFKSASARIQGGGWKLVNCFLTNDFQSDIESQAFASVLVSDTCGLDADTLYAIEDESKSAARFFILDSVDSIEMNALGGLVK